MKEWALCVKVCLKFLIIYPSHDLATEFSHSLCVNA